MRKWLIKSGSLLLFALVGACTSPESQESEQLGRADVVLDKMLEAHGTPGAYQFIFRDGTYTFDQTENTYRYTRKVEKEGQLIEDELSPEGLRRTINGELIELTPVEEDKYAESLNAVIYFTLLPHKLTDEAVLKTDKGTTTIKGITYDVLEVRFKAEGGGKDFEDVFYYWANTKTGQMDYMAYAYHVNGGGVRFREAYNSRMVGQMRFQDYINYGAPIDTPLEELPLLYENGELEELSRIVNESVTDLPN